MSRREGESESVRSLPTAIGGRACAIFGAGLVLPLLVVADGAAAGPTSPERAVGHGIAESPKQVREYWTPRRLRTAEPVAPPRAEARPDFTIRPPRRRAPAIEVPADEPGPAARGASPGRALDPGATTRAPGEVDGKIFFTVGSKRFVCSGSVVASALHNVVFTAGHCVYDAGRWVDNLVFIPGYRDGSAPHGLFPAASAHSLDGWIRGQSFSYDIGAVTLSSPVQDVVGTRGIAFNKRPKRSYTILGYPVRPTPPFDGERLVTCASSFVGLDKTGKPASIFAGPCDMRQGASGGAWVIKNGQVNSVVSHGYCDQIPSLCGLISGPYFGRAALNLYKATGPDRCMLASQKLKKAERKLRKARKKHANKKLKRAKKKVRKARKAQKRAC